MKQSKMQSFSEVLWSTAIGYLVSLLSLFVILPILGIESTMNKNMILTLYFTVVSVIRGYVVRRWFNKNQIK